MDRGASIELRNARFREHAPNPVAEALTAARTPRPNYPDIPRAGLEVHGDLVLEASTLSGMISFSPR